jgi:glyoxylase-like metal-dependent hydrolase (beta-lactamase superfamily II)
MEEYQVVIAKYGSRSTVKSEVYLNYGLYHQEDEHIGMHYFVWILRNSERTILVDTGFSVIGGANRNRTLDHNVPALYEKLGIDPLTAPQIIITHGHFDHIGNLDNFPASQMLISKKEFDFWNSKHATRKLFHHSVEDHELEHLRKIHSEDRLEFFEGRTTLAPGVEVIEVGGHTPGQSVVKVNTSEGTVLLASDAIHFYEEYEADRPFMSVASLVDMYEAFDVIRTMSKSGEIHHLVSGHDVDTLPRFTSVDGELSEIVSTIGKFQ